MANRRAMSDGFGAAFGGLVLLAVLSGMAVLLGVALAGTTALRRRRGSVPDGLRYLSVVLVAGVLLVATFAVAALVDEAAALAAVFLATGLVPPCSVAVYLHRTTDESPVTAVATAGTAWSLPFLVGLAVTFGVVPVVSAVFDLAPAEADRLGLYWLAAALGGVVVGGTFWLAVRVGAAEDRSSTADASPEVGR